MANMTYYITVTGCEELAAALSAVSAVRFQAVAKIAAKNIYNRGMAVGGTPYKTGELRQSLTLEVGGTSAEVGYTKDYAPHVEFGHRTRNGGYVPGQHYLQRNVEQERDNFKKLLIANLGKVL